MDRRNHCVALDGLRGLAAFSVLLFHLGHWQQHPWVAGNAGQAVDFFFALSGYVLSVAYQPKLNRGMKALTFIRIRLIRLMPIIILGTSISASYFIARVLILRDPQINTDELSRAMLLGFVCLPTFNASKAIGGPAVFPLNAPQYTLFLELFVNGFWLATRRMESLWFALAIFLTSYVITAIFGMTGDQQKGFWTGFPRVFGAYYSGVAIYHAQIRWPWLSYRLVGFLFWPILFLTFMLFYWPMPLSPWLSWGWSLLFSPMLVLAGTRVQLNKSVYRTALVLGELSYPVYALHYPIFVWVNAIYQQTLHRKSFEIGSTLAVPAVLLGAWLILKWIDEPIRKALTAWTGKSAFLPFPLG